MSHDLLSDDLWRFIGSKLDAPDRVRFRAVCRSWTFLIPRTPWLMLAQTEEGQESASEDEAAHHIQAGEGEEEEEELDFEEVEEFVESEEEEGDELADENSEAAESTGEDEQQSAVAEAEAQPPPPPRGFFCLVDQQIYQADFPNLHKAQCVGSTGSWVVTAHKDKTIRLLNPFSKQQLYLPSQLSFEHPIIRGLRPSHYKLRHLHLWKVVLSSPPSPDGSHDCVAMAIHERCQILGMARIGDETWTTVGDALKDVVFNDVIFYKGSFYAVTHRGCLMVCDLGDGRTPPTTSYLTKSGITHPRRNDVYVFDYLDYLVEWCGELLMVIKTVTNVGFGSQYKTLRLRIYKFDFTNKKWDELNSLGNYSLFLGFNTSISLRASDYFGKIRENCVYFTDDFLDGYRGNIIAAGRDMGVFDLADQTIKPHFQGVSTCFYSPPVWILPN